MRKIRLMDEPLRERVRAICLALPECDEVIKNPLHSSFEVRGKAFCRYLNDHHGDGRVAVQFRGAPGAQEVLIGADPERFFRPAYVGHHGWVGMYLDVGPIDWEQLEAFIVEAHLLVAPRSVAKKRGLAG